MCIIRPGARLRHTAACCAQNMAKNRRYKPICSTAAPTAAARVSCCHQHSTKPENCSKGCLGRNPACFDTTRTARCCLVAPPICHTALTMLMTQANGTWNSMLYSSATPWAKQNTEHAESEAQGNDLEPPPRCCKDAKDAPSQQLDHSGCTIHGAEGRPNRTQQANQDEG